jgi:molybdopterin converting factor small subunit
LPEININFIGAWRSLLGARTVNVNVENIDEARDYVENKFGPVFEKKIKAMKVGKKESIWDNSNILLNGTNIKLLNTIKFKDGDKIDLLPRIAGG